MIGNLVGTAALSLLLQAPQTGQGEMTPEQQFQIAMEELRRGGGVENVAVPIAFFAMVIGIVWLNRRQRQAQMRAQAEFHRQLLEKFGSGREFAEFLGSKGSQRFLDALWSQSPGRYDHILRTMRNGIVMAALGLGMLALSWTDVGQLRIPAVLVLALGAGFLISAAISHRLSKRWEQKAETEGPQQIS